MELKAKRYFNQTEIIKNYLKGKFMNHFKNKALCVLLACTLIASSVSMTHSHIVLADEGEGTTQAYLTEDETLGVSLEETSNDEVLNEDISTENDVTSVTEETVTEQENHDSPQNELYEEDIVPIDSEPIDLTPAASANNTTQEGEWKYDSKTGKYWYRHNDGSYTKNGWEYIDGFWYHFDSSGWMQTGWLKIGNNWYYLEENGHMHISWLYIKDTNDYYYFHYDGTMRIGWLKLSNDWYYLASNGKMVRYSQTIEGKDYYFNGEGRMFTGKIILNDNYYYFGENGKIKSDWILEEGIYYYSGSDGVLVKYFQLINGDRYYFNQYAQMQTGWVYFYGDKDWRYFNPDSGKMVTGWKYIGSDWYYFNSDGFMHTGWLSDDGYWYYLEPNIGDGRSGKMHTGWLVSNHHVFYMNSSGKMQTGTVSIDNNDRHFNSNGYCIDPVISTGMQIFELSSAGSIKKCNLIYPRESAKHYNGETDILYTWLSCAVTIGKFNINNGKSQDEVIDYYNFRRTVYGTTYVYSDQDTEYSDVEKAIKYSSNWTKTPIYYKNPNNDFELLSNGMDQCKPYMIYFSQTNDYISFGSVGSVLIGGYNSVTDEVLVYHTEGGKGNEYCPTNEMIFTVERYLETAELGCDQYDITFNYNT